MHTIVFNGLWMGRATVGVSRYAENILRAMDEFLFVNTIQADIRIIVPKNRSLIPLKTIKTVVKGECNNKYEEILWVQGLFPSYVRKEKAIGVDLTLGLPVWGIDYIALHDCIYETFPENYNGHRLHRWMYMAKAKTLSKRKNTQFITVSEESKKEIQKYYSISPDCISVIGNGWEHMEGIAEDSSIFNELGIPAGKEYFFSLGSRYKHKNIQWIVNVAIHNPQFYFIATGSDSFSDEIEYLKINKPANMIFTGYVTDGQMKSLMKNCKAFIQPSLYEGFGIPPLEALSLGKEIIVSNTSCLPEIFQHSAHYIDPYNSDVSIEAILSSPVSGFETVLAEHTWKNSAMKMLRLLQVI